MKAISKFNILLILSLIFSNYSDAQITIAGVDANSSKSIHIPVSADKIVFTDFTFKISTEDSLAKIKNIKPFNNNKSPIL